MMTFFVKRIVNLCITFLLRFLSILNYFRKKCLTKKKSICYDNFDLKRNLINGGKTVLFKGYFKLKVFFKERGITQDKVAADLGISRTMLNRKMNRNKTDFTLDEIRKLCEIYKLKGEKFFLKNSFVNEN